MSAPRAGVTLLELLVAAVLALALLGGLLMALGLSRRAGDRGPLDDADFGAMLEERLRADLLAVVPADDGLRRPVLVYSGARETWTTGDTLVFARALTADRLPLPVAPVTYRARAGRVVRHQAGRPEVADRSPVTSVAFCLCWRSRSQFMLTTELRDGHRARRRFVITVDGRPRRVPLAGTLVWTPDHTSVSPELQHEEPVGLRL
jgi:hypothetical protein